MHFNINNAIQIHVWLGIFIGGNFLFVVENILDPSSHSTYKILTISYPSRALKGQPTMAPAAIPSTARLGRPWNQPVIATTVLYMQNVLGRKAAHNTNTLTCSAYTRQKRKIAHKQFSSNFPVINQTRQIRPTDSPAEEQNIPALRTRNASRSRPTCKPNFLHTALCEIHEIRSLSLIYCKILF